MPALAWKGVSNLESAAQLVGPRLRQLRENRGLTIRELAARADVSKNTILRIEQGLPISEPLLHRICNKLQTILPNLLLTPTDTTVPIRIHRREQDQWRITFRKRRAPKAIVDFDPVDSPEERQRLGALQFVSGFLNTLDCALPQGRLQSAIVDLHGDQDEPGFRHSGEEFVICLEGRLRLTLRDETYILHPGDAATFESQYRHRYESDLPVGSPATRMLMVWYEAPEMAEAIAHDAECETNLTS
ncbi:MAG: XRE family transcriptional regulator [Fimbriimonadaceae bacterium]|nr:XRE family transcriptional regulator [Fimbriimonadaceae bacterium]